MISFLQNYYFSIKEKQKLLNADSEIQLIISY